MFEESRLRWSTDIFPYSRFYAKEESGTFIVKNSSESSNLGNFSYQLAPEEGKTWEDYFSFKQDKNVKSNTNEYWEFSARGPTDHNNLGYFPNIETAMIYLEKLPELAEKSENSKITDFLVKSGFEECDYKVGSNNQTDVWKISFKKDWTGPKRTYSLFFNKTYVHMVLDIGTRKSWINMTRFILSQEGNGGDCKGWPIPRFWPNYVKDPINLGIYISVLIMQHKEQHAGD